jgi:hypothetical protein
MVERITKLVGHESLLDELLDRFDRTIGLDAEVRCRCLERFAKFHCCRVRKARIERTHRVVVQAAHVIRQVFDRCRLTCFGQHANDLAWVHLRRVRLDEHNTAAARTAEQRVEALSAP